MRRPTLAKTLIATLLLSTLLAGCLKPSEDAAPVDDAGTNQTGFTNATTAPIGTSISAFNETNATETTGTGSMVHEHDYWNDKERLDDVAWIDSALIPFPLMPCAKPDNSCSAGASTPGTDTYPPLTAIADYDLAAPPEMGMVYEGTKIVELKLVRFNLLGAGDDPPNPAGKVFFDYLPANDEPGKFRKGGELKLNEPFQIQIEPTDADMPHQTKSLWIFRIYSNTEMVTFSFNITVSLVKGYDVVNWPPHPNLYADKTERLVHDGPIKLASKGSVDGILFGSDAGWLSPQRVISWGTDRVEIQITDVAFTGQLPVKPSGFVLEYRNASTPFLMANGVAYGGRMVDPGTDGKTYNFVIDLAQDDGRAYDTPYAQYSRWGFRLVPYWEDAGGVKCVDELFFPGILFGCQWYPWEMTYNMKIIAYGRSTAEGVPESA